MQTLIIAKELHVFHELDSTQAEAKRLLSKSSPVEGCAITAAIQSSGRGRMGRSWTTKPSTAILCSMILYPRFLQPATSFYLNVWLSLAVRSFLIELLPEHVTISIKWPNDIWINGAKVGGLLIETAWQKQLFRHAILGVGINVFDKPTLPDADYPICCLADFPDALPKLDALQTMLFESLDRQYVRFSSHWPESRKKLIPLYQNAMYGIGRKCQLVTGAETIAEGILIGVNDQGAVKLDVDGQIQSCSSGSLRFSTLD